MYGVLMRHLALTIVCLGIVSCSSSSSKNIGPDGTLPDGGKIDPNAPEQTSKPNPSDPSKIGASGSRLKARFYAGEDGSQQFVGWYDSQLQKNCTFTPTGDGKLRCVVEGLAGRSGYFADTGCSQPTVVVSKGCTPPSLANASATSAGSCGTTFSLRIANVGAKHVGPVYAGTPASCIAAGAAFTTDILDYYDIGADVPLTTYVLGSENHE